MKYLRWITIGFGMAILGGFLILGCAVEPVRVDWPVSHPANPEAEEAAFTPLASPFTDAAATTGDAADSDATMIDKKRGAESSLPMDHQTGHGNMRPPAGKKGGQQPEKGTGHGTHH